VGILPEKKDIGVYKLYLTQAHEQLKIGGLFIVSSTSTVISRIEEFLSKQSLFEILKREKDKGQSTILLQKRN
jgi:TusA-related sulfurtransferase